MFIEVIHVDGDEETTVLVSLYKIVTIRKDEEDGTGTILLEGDADDIFAKESYASVKNKIRKCLGLSKSEILQIPKKTNRLELVE